MRRCHKVNKKGDPELNKLIASRTKERTARGAAHTETKVWTLLGPDDTIHTVVGLHEFCQKHGLSATSIQYSINTNKPIKKGKSKGWRLLSKKIAPEGAITIFGDKA